MSRIRDTLAIGVPHHSYHVLNLFRRTGHHAIPHTLETMDACRISWGKVQSVLPGDGSRGDWNTRVLVRVRPLVYRNNSLALGGSEVRTALDLNRTAGIDDWVTLHWGYVCGTIGRVQLEQLRRATDLAIQAANMSS
jgi:hypothetical protein